MSDRGASSFRCPFCGHLGALVSVHGHDQCAKCGTNVGPCCSGADAATEAATTDEVATGPDPKLFAVLFEHLGGVGATVTSDSLLFALVQRLGTDLDDARVVLEAAERVGLVVNDGNGGHHLRAP